MIYTSWKGLVSIIRESGMGMGDSRGSCMTTSQIITSHHDGADDSCLEELDTHPAEQSHQNHKVYYVKLQCVSNYLEMEHIKTLRMVSSCSRGRNN